MFEDNNIIIRLNKINKSYGGVKVLSDVDFELKQGEIHGLVGKNGAGKSTLMKILYGVESCDSGAVELYGTDLSHSISILHKHKSIAMIFQELSLIPSLTVSQNIFLSNAPRTNIFFLNLKKCIKQTKDILKQLQVDIDTNKIVEDLSSSEKQIVEIAKALVQDKKILIMDEPTTSFTSNQVDVFFETTRKLKNHGVSIIYISHNLKHIFQICNRITVIRDGKKILTSNVDVIDMDSVIFAMTGKGKETKRTKKTSIIKTNKNHEPVLKIRNMNFGRRLSKVSFELYSGEILGIAGLTGSGRTELLESIYGINKTEKGSIYLNKKKFASLNPKIAIELGLSLVPDERQTKGLVIYHSVADNIVLPILSKVRNIFFIKFKKILEIVNNMIKKLNIITSGANQTVMSLSGGNQQKVVIAKCFITGAHILLLDDPTLGIDVESKGEIIKIMGEYVSNGENSVILVSSELEVLENICDRVLIMKEGKIINEIEDSQFITESKLISLIQ
jgi:ribose transport system ATP-binding protein